MKKIFLPFAFLVLASCSDDSSSETVLVDPNVDYYIEALSYEQNGSDYVGVTTQQITGNRLVDLTSEMSVDGISQGIVSAHLHEYDSAGRLIRVIVDNVIHSNLYYNSAGDFVGRDYGPEGYPMQYYRVVYPASGTVFLELIDAPYTDSNAQTIERYVGLVNANGIVTSAGTDADLDGVADSPNTFVVSGDDVISFTRPNGTVYNYSYSGIVDTQKFISRHTFGQKTYNIYHLNILADTSDIGVDQVVGLLDSRHLRSDLWASGNYEAAANGFVSKKTETWVNSGIMYSKETEYFFE